MRRRCDMHGRVDKLDHPATPTVAGGACADNFANMNHQPRGAPSPPLRLRQNIFGLGRSDRYM